jgi:ABC-type multidrug transport system ATPase subunit
MAQIQAVMGICPQFDILWNELTGEEHLYLFAGLRDTPKEEMESEVSRLLKEVALEDSAHVRSASYSGGMKRRLSVAVSLIGNPKIVFLDEPTTGMDPVSRRQVWNIIERAKKDKVIILTTHSMEEADVLGDKIGIMAKGKLSVIGSSLHLKQKFGAGYHVSVGVDPKLGPNQPAVVQDFFTQEIKGAKLHGAEIGGYMNFLIPRSATNEMVSLHEVEFIDKDI